jgi:hypothetical protein
VVILTALGSWPQRGTFRALDWERTAGDRCEDREMLLIPLYARRLWSQHELRVSVHDGGAGLKAALRKWYRKSPAKDVPSTSRVLRPDRPGRENRQMGRLLFRRAAAVFRASDELTARFLLADLADRWEAEKPQAVAALLRDREDTLRFHAISERNPL